MLTKLALWLAVACGLTFFGVPLCDADATLEGKIIEVKLERLVITVNAEQRAMTIASDAKITLNGKPAKTTDLAAGQVATVTVSGDMKNLIAKSIVAFSPK